MTYRFFHLADIHLGRHEHGSPERYADYFAALSSVVTAALREKVDALLIAGDLFDTPEPSAETLRRVMNVLRPLRDAGVEVLAIEGNHDRRKRGERTGALDLLASEGYLKLLRPSFDDGALRLDPWTGEGGGLYRPHDAIAIAGLGFIPHSIEEHYARAAGQLPRDAAVIVLAHVMAVRGDDALEYGCIAMEDLNPLGAVTAYLALGHRHTRLGSEGETDGWIFNPGSLEYVNSLDYHQPPELRGYFDVTVDVPDEGLPVPDEERQAGITPDQAQAGAPVVDDSNGADDTGSAPDVVPMPAVEYSITDGVLETSRGGVRLRVVHVPTDKRPARTLRVDISGCAQPDDVIEAVARVAGDEVYEALRAAAPILVVRLQGAPALSRVRIPRAAIADRLREDFDALHVEVLDRDLLGGTVAGRLLGDDDGLELLADRARAIAAELLAAQGIAHGREADLSATLLDLKAQLHGTAKNPSHTVLERMGSTLQPFVEYDSELPVADDAPGGDADDRSEAVGNTEDTTSTDNVRDDGGEAP